MCFLHGRHREGLQWQIQGAEEQWVSVDTCSRGAGPKTKVRDTSLNSELSLSKNMFFASDNGVFAAAAVIVLRRRLWTKKKNKQSHKTPVFPSCSSPKTNSCQCFYICARGTEFTPDVFLFFFLAAVEQAGMLCRWGLGGCLQVVHYLPRRHSDFHQVVPADGRVRPLGQRQTLLHPYHQQVGICLMKGQMTCTHFTTSVSVLRPSMGKIYIAQ